MPQLASISSGGSKSKVACETTALPLSSDSDAGVRCGTVVSFAVARPDDAGVPVPADSVLRRVHDGVGFVELFGAALRRDGSTKGSSNPKAAAAAASKGAGAPRTGSRRTPPGKAAVVVAVLPAGNVVAQERRGWRRPASRARVFASEAVGATEPVSPKVSCFGAVRAGRRASAPPEKQTQQEAERDGCWASVAATVRRLCWNGDPRAGEPEASESDSSSTVTTLDSAPDTALSPPRLGDAKRLASRRWPEPLAGREGPFGLV